ncbi:MAG: ABC transporter permease [Clostridium sp.]|nr:ABC transporter permease [Clostridium sp.]
MSNFFTILKKELIDIIRDRKTIAFTILLPILIYPVLFQVMSITMKSSQEDAKKEINVVINGDKDSKLSNLLNSQENIKEKNYDNPKKALKDGDLQLIINIPSNVDEEIEKGNSVDLEIFIDDQSEKSKIAGNMVESLINDYSKSIVESRLSELNVDSKILTPINIETKSGINKDGTNNSDTNTILGMIPGLIVIMLLSPTMGLAADLGAGEKERGTFEPLLSTSVNRNSILWGKITTISIISVFTLVLSMVSLLVSFKGFLNSVNERVGESINLNINIITILFIILFCIFIIIFMSTLQVVISISARSTKEANTYLSGLIIPIMLLAFIPIYMDVKNIGILFFNIPIINSICVMKEIMIGIYNTTHILIVLAWHIFYVALVLILAKILFSREELIFRS